MKLKQRKNKNYLTKNNYNILMENSVEIMCIDICLNSSNIKRMGEKRRVIVIMYSIKLLTPAPE